MHYNKLLCPPFLRDGMETDAGTGSEACRMLFQGYVARKEKEGLGL